MAEKIELNVHLAFDEASNRWYVSESDIPGLWLEADTPTQLMDRIQTAAPEMIELNCAEIIQRHLAAKNRLGRDCTPERPIAIRPVFDSPLALA